MVLVILKNLLFPPDKRPSSSHSKLSSKSYGTISTPQKQSFPESSSPGGLSQVSTDVDVDIEAQRPLRSHKVDNDLEDELLPQIAELTAEQQFYRSSDDSDDDDEEDEKNEPKESWKPSARVISDAIIGLSDGMTVPFALTAGLTGLGDTRVVVLGGLAELIAGAISMGLGGYIGAKSEAECYVATQNATADLIATRPRKARRQLRAALAPLLLHTPAQTAAAARTLEQHPRAYRDALVRLHHGLAEPDTSRPLTSASTIAAGYFVGGFVPLLPYFFVGRGEVLRALWWSVGVMAIALFVFGWVKTAVVVGWRGGERVRAAAKGGVQMVVVGGVAAGAAVALVRFIEGS